MRTLIFATATLLAISRSAVAQLPSYCDAQRYAASQDWLQKLTPAQRQAALQTYRKRSDAYCEGLDSIQIGASDDDGHRFALLSLTAGGVAFRKTDVALHLAVSNNQLNDISVRATSIHRLDYYRLDGQISGANSVRWDLSQVVHPADLKQDTVGIVAFRQGIEPIYVPLQASTTVPVSAPPADHLVAVVKPSLPVQDLQWRWVSWKDGLCAAEITAYAAASTVAGVTDSIRSFSIELKELKSAMACVEVRGKQRNGEWVFGRFAVAF